VPVFASHSEAVHVETTQPIDPQTARRLFARTPGVIVVDDPATHAYPLATDAADRDEVFVGRIRQDSSRSDGRGLAFWVVSDNRRKGAATNAVQIAELVARRGWLEPASRRLARAS
jgi:aspartate-semialdehyde dehydrogenase